MMSDPTAAKSEDPGATERKEAEIRREEIEQRAYEISLSSEAQGDLDNWLRAEREVQALDGPA
jgi:hypothetical protein